MAARSRSGGRVRVTLVRSPIGFDRRQRATLRGLGLSRLHQTVELPDEPAVRGMIDAARHFLRIED